MSENPPSDPLAMLRSGRGLPDAAEVDDPIREQLLDAAGGGGWGPVVTTTLTG